MLRITKHAIERYYERILKQPIPENINTLSEFALKIQAEINIAYLQHSIKLEGKYMLQVNDTYKAIMQDGRIVTVTETRKVGTVENREAYKQETKQARKKVKKQNSKYKKYHGGKRTY